MIRNARDSRGEKVMLLKLYSLRAFVLFKLKLFATNLGVVYCKRKIAGFALGFLF